MQFVMYFNVVTILLFSFIGIGIALFLRLVKKKSFVYLMFFAIFYIYIVTVLDYTLFQYQSLLLLKHFVPGLILNGVTAGESMQIIPLITLTVYDVKTSLLNILLMIPFGFGLPFITYYRMKKVVFTGVFFSVAIELAQFLTGFMAKMTFRVADINDVIFNTIGVVIGYILFVGFMRFCRYIFRNHGLPANLILQYIAERPQVEKENPPSCGRNYPQ